MDLRYLLDSFESESAAAFGSLDGPAFFMSSMKFLFEAVNICLRNEMPFEAIHKYCACN